jgi:hypothetical protein
MFAGSFFHRRFRAGLLLLSALLSNRGVARSDEVPQVPLSKVVLFNSGVGYFERRAEIEGDLRAELKFNVDDVNDLLQSMVLEDLGGGTISTVTYASKEPLARTLQTFGIDLADEPTLAELLRQVRGEKVRVESPEAIQGVIVGVEKRSERVGEERVVETETLNLLTDKGLASVPLASVRRIKLLNEKLDTELRQALAVLAAGHASDKKAVTLSFVGEGKRRVRVGYVQEAPIWKTSYRLVLSGDKPAFLQGWAIVENATDDDWSDVSLTLVSGRPISFVTDLYQSLYVARPIVQPDLYGTVRPQTYDLDLAAKDAAFRRMAGQGQGPFVVSVVPTPSAKGRGRGGAGGGFGGMGGSMMGGMGGGMGGRPNPLASEPIDPGKGVETAAETADVGELFQYSIKAPLSLARQQSAMLSIVNDAVEARKVGVYNSAVHRKHPLNGLKLKNTTALHLMQGPITVFDGGAYAGNAKVLELPPDGERLVTYALDLETEIAPEPGKGQEQLVSARLVKGLLHRLQMNIREQTFVVKNSSAGAKRLLIEHPIDATWELVAPAEPTEKTRDRYRFAVDAQPGVPVTLKVVEEQPVRQEVKLTDLNDEGIAVYLSAKEVTDAVKAALSEVVERKSSLAELAAKRQVFEQAISTIAEEQSRIRQNMAQIERQGELYARYVKKFGEQEDQIEKLRKDRDDVYAHELAERKSLDEYLAGLTIP